MRNMQQWVPSKYILTPSGLTASRDPRKVAIGSRLMAQKAAQFFSEAIPEHVRGRLLDLGCGSAPLFGLYRNYASEIVCVDWGASSHDIGYVDIEHDINMPLPFTQDRFDTVILSDVLEHVFEPQQLWNEVARVLAPDGKLILNVPFLYWLHERPFDFYRYTEFALRLFAERSGLRLVHLDTLGGAPEVLTDIAAKVLARYRLGKRPASALQAFCGWLVRTRKGATFSKKTAASFPFGYTLIAQKPRALSTG